MEALRETTNWPAFKQQPNHTYLIDSDRCLGYIPWNTGTPQFFIKPLRFSKRNRTFEKTNIEQFGTLPIFKSSKNTVQVYGSQNKIYTVDLDKKTCTCSGFKFRGTCKHLEKALDN